jgi:hypothetical protein
MRMCTKKQLLPGELLTQVTQNVATAKGIFPFPKSAPAGDND